MNENPTEVRHVEDEELSHLNNSPPELANDTDLVAELACVPTQQRPPFCDWVCASVQSISNKPTHAVASQPSRALLRAAEAARTLNEAVCSLNEVDREQLDKLAAHDTLLQREKRLRGSTEPFQTDELQWTVFLLDRLFNIAVGKVPPLMVGAAALRNERGRKPKTVNNPSFHEFVWLLLSGAASAGGELTLDQNFKKGTLADALNILRKHLPIGVIPNALPFGTIQKIKTAHSKYRCLPDGL